jgi:hypothetical protein
MTTTRHLVASELVPAPLLSSSRKPRLPDAKQGGGGRLSRVWGLLLNHVAPLGYEDEQGFHYGQPPFGDR